MRRPALLMLLLGAGAAVLRRRRATNDADVWTSATSTPGAPPARRDLR